MMRVIAGRYRSRQLKGKPPAGTRPTSDKLRETLFNVLGETVRDAAFLDGFAGMGGVGIEALSRGASFVCFVDKSRRACSIIRENLEGLKITEGFRVIEEDLDRALDLFERQGVAFDIVFLDPPYDRDALYVDSLSAFAVRPLLNRGAVLVVEHSKRVVLAETVGNLRCYRSLTQGDSTLSFYRTPNAEG
jgi:16S rRNA (guanine(966)-N(2))-methyltransferase RsmD